MGTDGQSHSAEENVRTITVDPSGLKRVGARPGPLRYLQEIWHFRSFILFDSRSRISGTTTSDSLGQIWLVINPILNGATYFFVFGILLGTGRGIPNFIAYLIIGVFMFRFTTTAVTSGSKAIIGNRAVVRAFNFPRATLPIAVNVRELMLNIPTFITMFALILVIPPMETITWKWLLFIPVLALQFLMNLGLSLLLARLVTRWNDLTHLITFGTRIWLYLSCVFFSVDRFAGVPFLINVMHANPMFCVLDITRDLILYDTWPPLERWGVLAGWALVSLVIGYLVFWKAEESYGQEK